MSTVTFGSAFETIDASPALNSARGTLGLRDSDRPVHCAMRAILFAVLAGLCWGVGEIFTKKALNTGLVGPMTALFVRACVTVVLSAGAYVGAAHVLKSEPADWAREAGLPVWLMLTLGSGLLAGFAGVFFFYAGLASPGGDISKLRPIAFALAPATAVILGWAVLGEGMSVRKGVACGLILLGIVMLTGGSRAGSEKSGAVSTRTEAAGVK